MAVFCGIYAVPPREIRGAGFDACGGNRRNPRKSAGFDASRRSGAQPFGSSPNLARILRASAAFRA
jgi:hypothetical protein